MFLRSVGTHGANFKISIAPNVPMERFDHSQLLIYPSNVPTEHNQQFDFVE
jgi:hypothetical protein